MTEAATSHGSAVTSDAFASEVQDPLVNLARDFNACERCCVSQNGVTVAQGNAILAFGGAGSTTVRELSEAAGLTQSTMTRTVDQLVPEREGEVAVSVLRRLGEAVSLAASDVTA